MEVKEAKNIIKREVEKDNEKKGKGDRRGRLRKKRSRSMWRSRRWR